MRSVHFRGSGGGANEYSVLSTVDRHVRLALISLVLCALFFWAVYGLLQARRESAEINFSLAEQAQTIAHMLDLEAISAKNLLIGLSKSASIRSGRYDDFHHELVSVHREGAWFALFELDQQVVNSRIPFGATLPKLRDRSLLEHVRREGFYVSNVVPAAYFPEHVIVGLLRIDGANGEMTNMLAVGIPATHFSQLLGRVPSSVPESAAYVLDRAGAIVTDPEPAEPPPKVSSAVSDAIKKENASRGTLRIQSEARPPFYLNYARSETTGFVALLETPQSVIEAPLNEWRINVGIGAVCLAMVGCLAWLILRRRIAGPINDMAVSLIESQQTIQESEAAEQIFGKVSKASPILVYIFDIDTRLVEYINSSEFAPTIARSTMLSDVWQGADEIEMVEYLSALRSLEDNAVHSVVFHVNRRGATRWFKTRDMVFSRESRSRVSKIMGIAVDITETKAAHDEVDSLAMRLVAIQERERQRYAAELHDSTAQHLVAVDLNMMILREKTQHEPGIGKLLDEIGRALEEAQREIRSVSYLLYPRNLDKDGLSSTLARYLDGFSARTKILSKLKLQGELEVLPISIQRSALRIVQEALTNVHRHARATAVRVEIKRKDRKLFMLIQDNGAGFRSSPAGEEVDSGVGVPGMRARARQFGGKVRISTGKKGTRVFVSMTITKARPRRKSPLTSSNRTRISHRAVMP